jgi:hypothetical protein
MVANNFYFISLSIENIFENVLILVTKAKVNKLSICISIANVNLSVYLFSIDVLKLSNKMCIGYFNTVTDIAFLLVNE